MKPLAIAFLLVVPLRAHAQVAIADRVDAYLRDEMARQQIASPPPL